MSSPEAEPPFITAVRAQHSEREVTPTVLQLNDHLASGGTVGWEKRPSKSNGEEMGVAYTTADGRRVGEPGKDVQIDVGPVNVHAVYLPKTTDMQGNPAPASQWALDVQLDASDASLSAEPGSTAHALGILQKLFGDDLVTASHSLKCLWDPKKTPDAPYHKQVAKSAEKYAAWYAMCVENNIAPGVPPKVTKQGKGDPVVTLKLKVVGRQWSKETPTEMETKTRDYALSCPGEEGSPEYAFFEANIANHVVRLPFLRYTKEFPAGDGMVPAGSFRSVLEGIGAGSSIFIQGAIKSWINPNKGGGEPFFRWEPTGITIVKAVPRAGAGAGTGKPPVDYDAMAAEAEAKRREASPAAAKRTAPNTGGGGARKPKKRRGDADGSA